MRKIKIAWFTGRSFVDVDEPIVPELSKYFDIRWVVVRNKDCWFSESDVKSIFSRSTGDCKVFTYYNRMKSPQTAKVYHQALSYLKDFSPDFYYINDTGIPYLWPMLLLSSIPNSKLIYACHDYKDHIGVKNRSYYVLTKRIIFRFIKHFQFFSNTQKSLFESNYKGKKVFFAPLALKSFGPQPSIKKDDNEIQFLFFGSIRENKGLQYLIDAVNQISDKYHGKFKVKIAGGCSNWDNYSQLIANQDDFELDIRRIENNEIPLLFGKAHYLILPYIDVTQSGPLLISYNYNLPLIASNHPGFREYIVDESNGFLFTNQNSESLASVLEKVILNKESYSTICKELHRFVEDNCSLNRVIERYRNGFIQFYEMSNK